MNDLSRVFAQTARELLAKATAKTWTIVNPYPKEALAKNLTFALFLLALTGLFLVTRMVP